MCVPFQSFNHTILRSWHILSSKNLKLNHVKRINMSHCMKIKEQTPSQHDIALLHLKNPLILTENVSTIAIADTTPQPGSTVRASGMHVQCVSFKTCVVNSTCLNC